MLRKTTLSILGSPHPEDNPLPFFTTYPRHTKVLFDDTHLPQDVTLAGYETAPRFLPYRVQDIYQRAAETLELPAIVLENEYLKATFLPSYGGRLYSLYSKKLRQELLFKNSVIQPANLAVLNAWIAGGIEWNVGQYGHAFTTSAPVFCAALQTDEGDDFLRIYEYERTHGLFWQIDFHLPAGSPVLCACVRIVNDAHVAKPLYYWTNIALPENARTRIFSSTEKVLYLEMANRTFGRSKMPFLPSLPGMDVSYPQKFDYSNEYFFQVEQDEISPWEAAVQPEGWMFFERSTQPLRYRKMFCWGHQAGGRHWKDYLSQPGKGDYVEIQAGLSPTQLHGAEVAANSELVFCQCFGGVEVDASTLYNPDWQRACAAAKQAMNSVMDDKAAAVWQSKLKRYLYISPHNLIFSGTGFGALEEARRQTQQEAGIPAGFYFPETCMGPEQASWLALLHGGIYTHKAAAPPSYIAGKPWLEALQNSFAKPGGRNAASLLQYGILLMEENRPEQARAAFDSAMLLRPEPLAARCLAVLANEAGQTEQAEGYYKTSLSLAVPPLRQALLEEYFAFLLSNREYDAIWNRYNTLTPTEQLEERILLPAAQAALVQGELAFVEKALEHDFVYIRENATLLSDLWLQMHQEKEKKISGRHLSLAQIEKLYPVPLRLDFRTV